MLQAIRTLKPNAIGGALKPFTAARSIHSTSVTPNPAVLVSENRHLSESNSVHVVSGHSRAISTRFTSPLGFSASSSTAQPLGPRAQASFNTSIPRQDLGFVPFESSIIFPIMDQPSAQSLIQARVPFLPENLNPIREPEAEPKVQRAIISTVSDSTTHIAAPSAIMEGLNLNLSFDRDYRDTSGDVEEIMLRAFRA